MKKTLFAHVLAGMIDNNNINDAEMKDWKDATDAISMYEDTFENECSDDEMQHTIDAIELIISSNDKKRQQAIKRFNETIFGINFVDQNDSVAV